MEGKKMRNTKNNINAPAAINTLMWAYLAAATACKLDGLTTLSWLILFSPLWLPVAIGIAGMIIFGALWLLLTLIIRLLEKKGGGL
jgi:hypothetical protein